jgi:flagellum-specific peptidoglycan hydrolase FlgJ
MCKIEGGMKKYLISFIVGILLGSAIIFALYNIGTPPASESQQILDDVIQEWTSPSNTSQVIQAFFFKLKEAKIGFLPDTVISLAKRIDSIYGVPKGVTCAQYILESKWGLCDLKVNNYFGHSFLAVKQYMKVPNFVWRQDKIYLPDGTTRKINVRFARYRDITECFETHGKYLQGSKRYQVAFKAANSPERFARQLAKAGYAADPDYAIKLIVLMRRYKLS